jgi:hypothetical protein
MMVESQKPKRTAVESAASARLIQAGRRRFQHLLGATGQRYDADYWDLQSLKREMVSSAPRNLRFTSYQHRSLLPGTFVEVVKAWLVLRYAAVATMWTSLQAAKYLWETLEQRHGADFDWTQLSEADFNEMEVWLRARFAPSTVRSTMSCILGLIDFLAAHNVCRPTSTSYRHLHRPLSTSKPWPDRRQAPNVCRRSAPYRGLPTSTGHGRPPHPNG